MKRNPEIYQYLPLYCRIAIERLDGMPGWRNPERLDSLIDSYAKAYGETCDEYLRESTHYRASKRFYDFEPQSFNLI
jgi:hypothetical protein